MSMASLIPVILSGGSGTRLWPLSRKLYPKQFIQIRDGKSLFQSTVERILAMGHADKMLVICNEEHRFLAAEQLRLSGLEHSAIILEPVGRNTAPAIAIAAIHALERDPDAKLLVLPADHIVQDLDKFEQALSGAWQAGKDRLVAFGVLPRHAETGYGYIRFKRSGSVVSTADRDLFDIEKFVEKPDFETARTYHECGDYLWNSGMFLFPARLYIQEIRRWHADIYQACHEAYVSSRRNSDFILLDKQSFARAPSISVDYAVMEKTSKAAVIRLDSNWSDIGSWHALWDSFQKDSDGNATSGDVITKDCKGCYIHASHRLVAAVGTEDLVIAETADAILVAPHNRAQEVKNIVARLREDERSEVEIHPKVYRPWGAYETVDIEDSFQVKRITVNPGQALSLQMHRHRAEHWVVVKGRALVTRGDDKFLLDENESTYIPAGTRHRLENPGTKALELIEVQSGSYLGEDDIIRFEDAYGR